MIKELSEKYPSYAEFFQNNAEQLKWILKYIDKDEFFPTIDNMFRFAEVPINKIKCVIVGMEPYASWYEEGGKTIPAATGRSFEVRNINDWTAKYKQASLRNIFKSLFYFHSGSEASMAEIRKQMKLGNFNILPPHEWFDSMEKQGVMFLNASLSVKKDEPDSHTLLWNDYMTKLARYMLSKNPDIQWILAGSKAWERFEGVVPNGNIIKVHHPRTASFVKECPFQYVNNVCWVDDGLEF